jgi:uncharacterized protein (TIGR04222 family)
MNEATQTLYQRIQAYSLDSEGASFSFSRRLAIENSWTKEYSQRVINEYKKFVLLTQVAGHVVSPSDQVDQAWHLHLTYTRSYWDKFCKEVLDTPLHHEPTRGGQTEAQKFWQLYQQTLVSYERLFNEKPPSDIWPAPEQRFKRDVHFARINTQQHWLIRKPDWSELFQAWQQARMLPLLLFIAFVISGCAATSPLLIGSMTAGEVFWFDHFMTMSTGTFLWFYAGTFCLLLLIRAALNTYWPKTFQSHVPANYVRLSTEQLAYLAGGSDRLIHTALVSLIEQGNVQLKNDKQNFELVRLCQPQSPVEQAIIKALNDDCHRAPYLLARVKLSTTAIRIRDSLVTQGLWATATRHKTGLLFTPLILLGLLRLDHGISAGHPAVFLMAFLITTVLTPLMFGHDKRTSYGDEVLEHYKKVNESGNIQQSLCYELAMTGLSVLADTALGDIGDVLLIEDFLISRANSNSSKDIESGCGGGWCGGGGAGDGGGDGGGGSDGG